MAPPINVQDWYGDRHTCQIASGALDLIVVAVSLFVSELTVDIFSTFCHGFIA